MATTVMQMAEQLLLAAINRDRAAHGVAPLTLDSRQSRCSRKHSSHMAATGAISHDQFPADVCIPHTYVGENVGEDTDTPSTAVLNLHSLMMKEGPCPQSPCTGANFEAHGHYLNLVNPTYKRVGIGIVAVNGTTWLTEDFAS
ncbi:MAG TPA: CAP domain-containing protein [Chloroflexota bacterium]